MPVQITPLAPALPATTSIQDPAARRFAQAVTDALRTAQSTEFAIESLSKAAASFAGGSTPPSVAQWLFSSELYAKLTQAIEKVDVAAKQAIVAEAAQRVTDLADEAQARADDLAAEALARDDAIAAEVTARNTAIGEERTARIQALIDEAGARGAAITSEATTREDADGALALQITTLSSATDNNFSAVQTQITTLTNEDVALAERIDIVAATADAVRAATAAMVVTEVQARTEQGSALAQQITTLSAAVGDNQAAIQTESTTRANEIEALSEQITLISAGVGEQFDYAQIWYWDADAEGWTGNGTPAASGGWLRPADHATDPYIDSPAALEIAASTYSQIRVRVRKIGAPVWAGRLWWKATGDTTWDVARSAALDEPTYDGNDIGLVSASIAWTGTIDQVRLEVSSAQSATDAYTLDWFAIGRPSPGASNAALLKESTARAEADGAIATDLSSLQTTVTSNYTTLNSAITQEQNSRILEDSALSTRINTVSATATGKTKVFFQGDEPTATATNDLWVKTSDGNRLFRWDGTEWVAADDARIASNAALIASEQTARANADLALANDITTLSTTVTGNQTTTTTLISNEATARSDADTAISETLAVVSATADAVRSATAALVVAETIARASQDEAVVTRLDSLSVTVGENSAAITDEATARADADLAMTTQINSVSSVANGRNRTFRQETEPEGAVDGDLWLKSHQGNKAYRYDGSAWVETSDTRIATNEAAILTEQTTRADNDSALVQAINTAWALTGATNAVSQSGTNLITNWTTAQADKWAQLEAEVFSADGKTIRAALSEEATARANADGTLLAQWTVKIDTNGYIAGFGLASETTTAGENTSAFVIRADKFAFVMPGYSEHVPFAIGPSGTDFSGNLTGTVGDVPAITLADHARNKGGFVDTFESGDASQWELKSGTGEISVVSVADSQTGGKVLRVGNNSGNDNAWLIHKQNIPFDPTAMYRIKFRVRRTAGSGGVYLGLAGVAADGTTLVNGSGVNATSSQHYVAASNKAPGTTWTEYVGYVKGAASSGNGATTNSIDSPATLHSNVRYVRPMMILNYSAAAGTTEVDFVSIENLTEAMTWSGISGSGKPQDGATVGAPTGTYVGGTLAQTVESNASTALATANTASTNATTANNLLADIASDAKLTASEKQQTKVEWDGIVAEKAGINAQASAFDVTTENTAYNNAYSALDTYVTPLLTDLTTTSNIVGTTFRAKFSDLYAARQAVLNKIADEAGKRASWSSVSGIPYDTIYSNDDSVALGFNPTFSKWGGTIPDGWTQWGAIVGVKETTIKRVGEYAVKFTFAAGQQGGMRKNVMWSTAPMVAGTFVSGTVDAYLSAYVGPGKPGLLVDLYYSATAYRRTYVPLTSTATGVWQRVPFTARMNAGDELWGIQIYVMGSYNASQFGGMFEGTVIFDNLRFAFFDSTIDNKAITVASDGTLAGGGGGKVTITGLGYTGALDATRNTVYRQSTTPASPANGDIWVDTSVSPEVQKVRISGAWQLAATVGAKWGDNISNQPTSIGGINATEGNQLYSLANEQVNLVPNSGFIRTWVEGTNRTLPHGWAIYNNGGVAYEAHNYAGSGMFGTNIQRVIAKASTSAQFGIYTRNSIAAGGGIKNGWYAGWGYHISFYARSLSGNPGFAGKKMTAFYSNMGFSSQEERLNPPLVNDTWQKYEFYGVANTSSGNNESGELYLSWLLSGTLPANAGLDISCVQVEPAFTTRATQWSPSPHDKIGFDNPITPANATVYITDAWIGQAVVDGLLKSTNYAAGSSGWKIAKDGSVEFRNILARGDIEATSIKVGSANIIDTLMLQGNAVTIPVAASGSVGWQSNDALLIAATPYVNFYGAPRSIVVSAKGTMNYSDVGYITLSMTAQVKENGVVIATLPLVSVFTGESANVYSRSGAAAWVIYRNNGGTVYDYAVEILCNNGAHNWTGEAAITVLGVRR